MSLSLSNTHHSLYLNENIKNIQKNTKLENINNHLESKTTYYSLFLFHL